jgi:AraC-like DNA-binding protein
VEKNYHAKITSEEAARLCGMSPFRFGRAFKDAFGMAFRDYVVRVRLEEAGRLLQNPQMSVTEVAYAVGFNDLSYFSRVFKRHFGVSPSMMVESALTPLAAYMRPLELPPLLLPDAPLCSKEPLLE